MKTIPLTFAAVLALVPATSHAAVSYLDIVARVTENQVVTPYGGYGPGLQSLEVGDIIVATFKLNVSFNPLTSPDFDLEGSNQDDPMDLVTIYTRCGDLLDMDYSRDGWLEKSDSRSWFPEYNFNGGFLSGPDYIDPEFLIDTATGKGLLNLAVFDRTSDSYNQTGAVDIWSINARIGNVYHRSENDPGFNFDRLCKNVPDTGSTALAMSIGLIGLGIGRQLVSGRR